MSKSKTKIPLAGRSLALLLTLAAVPVQAQAPTDTTAHRVPFGSSGNTLELAVAAPAEDALGAVSVALVEAPAWLVVTPEAVALADGVAAGSEALAAFAFDVDRAAPAGEPGTLTFEVRDAAGAVLATKAVRLEVEAPRAVTLHPAYPNPFGGTRATVAFELPEAAEVEVAVFDVLGRRMAVLADGEREAGRHEAVWEAAGAASGVYLTRLVVETASGRRMVKVQRMTRLR